MAEYKWLPEIDLGEEIVGTMDIRNKVDVTDPCYDNGVWCRVDNIELPMGTYDCCVTRRDAPYLDDKGDKHHDVRVANSMIRLQDVDVFSLTWKWVGDAGVDAGCCGYFENKPDYRDEAWSNIVDLMAGENRDWSNYAWITEDGFWTDSGFGDGVYPVFVGYNENETPCAVATLFTWDTYDIDPAFNEAVEDDDD